jgi:hypothetical protein
MVYPGATLDISISIYAFSNSHAKFRSWNMYDLKIIWVDYEFTYNCSAAFSIFYIFFQFLVILNIYIFLILLS